MNIKATITRILTIGLLAGVLTACVTEKESRAKLEAKAKITKIAAEIIALAKVPNGTVKEGGIEEEKGKLIWSFDIATPGSQDITEVQVDALTGDVLDVSKETPAAEAKEKKSETKAKK